MVKVLFLGRSHKIVSGNSPIPKNIEMFDNSVNHNFPKIIRKEDRS